MANEISPGRCDFTRIFSWIMQCWNRRRKSPHFWQCPHRKPSWTAANTIQNSSLSSLVVELALPRTSPSSKLHTKKKEEKEWNEEEGGSCCNTMQKFSRKFSKTIWQKSETTTNSAIFGDPRWWTLAFLNELRVFCAAAVAAAAAAVAVAAALNHTHTPIGLHLYWWARVPCNLKRNARIKSK